MGAAHLGAFPANWCRPEGPGAAQSILLLLHVAVAPVQAGPGRGCVQTLALALPRRELVKQSVQRARSKLAWGQQGRGASGTCVSHQRVGVRGEEGPWDEAWALPGLPEQAARRQCPLACEQEGPGSAGPLCGRALARSPRQVGNDRSRSRGCRAAPGRGSRTQVPGRAQGLASQEDVENWDLRRARSPVSLV